MSCQLKFMITCKMLRATAVHLKMLPAISVSFLLQQPLNKGKYFWVTKITSRNLKEGHSPKSSAGWNPIIQSDWASFRLTCQVSVLEAPEDPFGEIIQLFHQISNGLVVCHQLAGMDNTVRGEEAEKGQSLILHRAGVCTNIPAICLHENHAVVAPNTLWINTVLCLIFCQLPLETSTTFSLLHWTQATVPGQKHWTSDSAAAMALSSPWMRCISTPSPPDVHRQWWTSLYRPLTVASEGRSQDWMESPGQFHLLPETHAAHASAVSGMRKWKEPGILVSWWVLRNVYGSEQST